MFRKRRQCEGCCPKCNARQNEVACNVSSSGALIKGAPINSNGFRATSPLLRIYISPFNQPGCRINKCAFHCRHVRRRSDERHRVSSKSIFRFQCFIFTTVRSASISNCWTVKPIRLSSSHASMEWDTIRQMRRIQVLRLVFNMIPALSDSTVQHHKWMPFL